MDKTICIVGLGLIGSSLALCIKKEYPNVIIRGYDINRDSALLAIDQGIIDFYDKDLSILVENVDYIFLCSNIESIKEHLLLLSKAKLKDKVIITDTGSTKYEIVEYAKKLGLDNFIGGHPMAGSHKSGIIAADENIFENAYYILTSHNNYYLELINLLKGTRAKFIYLDALEHDKIVGVLSHFPHILASSLVNYSNEYLNNYDNALELAGGGFRDMTRIAASNPKMWTDILLNNRNILLDIINKWEIDINIIKDYLNSNNDKAIYQFFNNARDIKNKISNKNEGIIPSFHDLFVNIPDIPGVVAKVTNILSEHELSLVNLRILETREDILGVLQLTFRKQSDVLKAKNILDKETKFISYEG